MNKVCSHCGSTDIEQDWYAHDQGICFVCHTCGFVGDAEEFKEPTVFTCITASPEVLAEKLVFLMSLHKADGSVKWVYVSTVVEGRWETRAEAIAATVAKLKEVCDE